LRSSCHCTRVQWHEDLNANLTEDRGGHWSRIGAVMLKIGEVQFSEVHYFDVGMPLQQLNVYSLTTVFPGAGKLPCLLFTTTSGKSTGLVVNTSDCGSLRSSRVRGSTRKIGVCGTCKFTQ